MAKKRAASRAASSKGAKKKAAKRPGAKKQAATSRTTLVRAGAAYYTKGGVDLRPLKKAIRLSIEQLAKAKETPKVAAALESLIAVQQRLTAECEPSMILPNS